MKEYRISTYPVDSWSEDGFAKVVNLYAKMISTGRIFTGGVTGRVTVYSFDLDKLELLKTAIEEEKLGEIEIEKVRG